MYYGKLKFKPCGKITAGGWLKDQLERSKKGMGGHLDELEPKMIIDPYIKKKTTAAWGDAAPGWGAEISGNFWYGAIALAFTLPDIELQKKVGDWVDAVLAVQCEDGYLGAYSDSDNLAEDYNAWGNACGMRALLLFAEASGRQDVFDAVHRGLLWFCRTDKWHFTAYGGSYICNLMAYVYTVTGDKELIDFCNRYEEYLNNTENDTFRVGSKAFIDDEFYYNQEHAAGYANLFARPANIFLADGDKNKLKASEKGYSKLMDKCFMVNGGISGNAEWLSPKSSTAETEYCTTTYFCSSLASLAAATGKAEYADVLEKAVFNVAQGARKKDERAITYFTAPNQLCATDHSSCVHDPHGMYAPAHSTSCCSVNSVVVMPEFVKNAAMTDSEDDLYILTYAPVHIEHQNTVLSIETMYPFRKDIKLKITSANGQKGDYSIYLRRPEWADGMSITACGKIVSEPDRNGFIKLEGGFEDGEEIYINIGMKPRIVELDDTDGADKHPLSVTYGPLCFCLPVKENWINKGNGYAQTELPDGWDWYEVQKVYDEPDGSASLHRLDGHAWNFAVTRQSLEESLTVTEEPTEGYVWEQYPIKISAKGWHAPYLYNHYTPRTNEPYGKTVPVSFEKTVSLVPFGCTNLRITCFPKADK